MDLNLAQAILTAAVNEQSAMVDFLKRLIKAESPSSIPESQAGIQSILIDALENVGLRAKLVPGRKFGGHLVAKSPLGNRSDIQQLLVGHCDTVWPVGTLKSMPLIHEENLIRGPGAYDMKSGLTQMIFALKIIKILTLETSLQPVVFINSDEETGSEESRSHLERLARQAQRVYVLEPSLGPDGRLKTSRKGVGSFDIRVKGKSAHAGLEPEKGTSAILEMSYLIQKLHDLNDYANGISVNIGKIEGGMQSNVVPPTCRVEIDVRIPSMKEARRIEQAILGLRSETPGIEINISGGINRPPLEETPRNEELWNRANELGHELGLSLTKGMSGGASDGNFTSQYAATLDGLGAVGDGAHAQHEFIFIDKMVERTALLAALLLLP